MKIRVQGSKWFDRIITALVLGVFVAIFGAIAAEELLGIDVEATVAPVVQRFDLTALEVMYLFMGPVFTLVGLVTLGKRGLPALRRVVTLSRNDPIPIDTLHLEEGLVEVQGTAERMEEFGTVTAPYSGIDCLAYRYEKKEKRRRGTDNDSDWRVVSSGENATPFAVTDETGTVVVDPGSATLTFDRDIVSNTGRTIKTEWRLEPGESAYVSGQKCDGTSDPDAPGRSSTYIGDGDGTSLTISDASERWTILRFLAKGIILSSFGLVMFGVGSALVYYGIIL